MLGIVGAELTLIRIGMENQNPLFGMVRASFFKHTFHDDSSKYTIQDQSNEKTKKIKQGESGAKSIHTGGQLSALIWGCGSTSCLKQKHT